MRLSPSPKLTAALLSLSVFPLASEATGQVPDPEFSAEGYDLFELRSGAYLEARLDRRDRDTLYLVTPDDQVLRFRTDDIAHGIVDMASGGEWRPRRDRRQEVSHRFLFDINMAEAEYGLEVIRAGVQLKYTPMYRINEHWLVGPMMGFSSLRADYGETLIPLGASAAYEFTPRIGVTVDGGYAVGAITNTNVRDASGGFHFHPRFVIRTAHQNHFTNLDFGIGYLYQRAEFLRFENVRYPGETAVNPALPGVFLYNIPYHRLSLSLSLTFG